MSSKGWSRGTAVQYAAVGRGIDAQKMQNYFLILVLDIRIFCLFDNYFFNLEINIIHIFANHNFIVLNVRPKS